MIEKIIKWIVQWNLKKRKLTIHGTKEEQEFRRVLNTLRREQYFVVTKKDGIYIRLAGDVNNGETSSFDWFKIKSFDNEENINPL